MSRYSSRYDDGEKERRYDSSKIGSSASRSSVSRASGLTYGPDSTSNDKARAAQRSLSSYGDDHGLAGSVANMSLASGASRKSSSRADRESTFSRSVSPRDSISQVGSVASSTRSGSTVKPPKSRAGSTVPSSQNALVLSGRDRGYTPSTVSDRSGSSSLSRRSGSKINSDPYGPRRASMAGRSSLSTIPEGSAYGSGAGPVSHPFVPAAREKKTASIERGVTTDGREYEARELSVERSDGHSRHRHRSRTMVIDD